MRKMIPILIILTVLLCACTQGTDLSTDSPLPAPSETISADTPAPPAEAAPSPEASPTPEATLPPVLIQQPENLSEEITGNESPAAPLAYEDLTDGEKDAAAELDDRFAENRIYEIDLESPGEQAGTVKYDFNGDGMIDVLDYELTRGEDSELLVISLGESRIECLLIYDSIGAVSAFKSIGLCDADRRDGAIDICIIKVSRNGIFETTSIYRLDETGQLAPLAGMDTALSGVSGDGKIYYWGGNLKETPQDYFNADYVVMYYDIALREYVRTDQIVGKTFTDLGGWLLFGNKKDVPTGGPVEMTEDLPGVIRRLEPGEEVTILAMPENDVVNVKTGDGTAGWLGGFHMVWD